VSATDALTRLRAIAGIVARRTPAVLTATTMLLESVLEAADPIIAAERSPTAPVTLTAEQVLELARARGVPVFAGAVGDRLILLASLGLDLTEPGTRAALVEMYQRHELRLAGVSDVAAARADLAARELRTDLVNESAIVVGDMTFHAVVIS
jgi:hypothetical protein